MTIGARIGLAASLWGSASIGVGTDEIASGVAVTQTTLTVALTDSADPVITSIAYSYALVVTNTGAADATTVTATVTLDASVTYVSASGTGWAVNAASLPVVSFTRATLAVGAAPAITVNVTSGGSALTASSTSGASASNAAAATPSVQTTVVKLVAKDATSGIRVPASSTEWTDFLAYYSITTGNPSLLWLCQEASGNLADSIGTFTGTATGAPSYAVAVPGWARVGVGTANASSSRIFNGDAGLPDGLTASQLTICYYMVTAGNSSRVFGQNATATRCALETTAAHLASVINNATITSGTGNIITAAPTVSVIKHNRTGTTQTAYTASEKITTVFDTGVSGKSAFIGSGAGNAPASTFIYFVSFFNAAAEMSDAQVKALLVALGWSIPWS